MLSDTLLVQDSFEQCYQILATHKVSENAQAWNPCHLNTWPVLNSWANIASHNSFKAKMMIVRDRGCGAVQELRHNRDHSENCVMMFWSSNVFNKMTHRQGTSITQYRCTHVCTHCTSCWCKLSCMHVPGHLDPYHVILWRLRGWVCRLRHF